MGKRRSSEPLVPLRFEGEMDAVGFSARNLQTGDKIRLVLECKWDEDTAAQMAHLFKKRFTVNLLQKVAPVLPFGGDGEESPGENEMLV